MTIVVLLILVALWVVVLGPSVVRWASGARSGDSIGTFHKQLKVLQRTGPELVAPVHRLGTPVMVGVPASPRPGAEVTRRGGLVVVRPDAVPLQPVRRVAGVRRPDPYFRPEACRRRRDVLLLLLAAVFLTAIIGAVPGAHMVLVVTAVLCVLVAAYIVLLVRMRNLALEREMKLRYLPDPVENDPPLVVARRVSAR